MKKLIFITVFLSFLSIQKDSEAITAVRFPNDTYNALLFEASITASTTVIVADATNAVKLASIAISATQASGADTWSVIIGVITENDATDGSMDVIWRSFTDFDGSNESITRLYNEFNHNIHTKQSGGSSVFIEQSDTAAQTDQTYLQNDVNLNTADGRQIAPAVGDIILRLEKNGAAGNLGSFGCKIQYLR